MTKEQLFSRKCELQREVLASWDRLRAVQQEHDSLLAQLESVRFGLRNPDNLILEL